MSNNFVVRGTIPEVIRNKEDLYQGDLKYYARVVFQEARNLNNTYHNFRHMLHVTWLCYNACRYYKTELTLREKRNLMIAALFHDFDHPGKIGNDDLNIEIAIRALTKHLLEEDSPYFKDIVGLIRPTEYPHKDDVSNLELGAQILQDADLMQALDTAWIQQVIGLAAEGQKSQNEALKMQIAFYQELSLCTKWAQELCPQDKIDSKIAECKELIEIFIND